jgi:transposase-like protein
VTVIDVAPPCPWCGLSSVSEISHPTAGSRRYTCGTCRRVFVIRLEPLAIEVLEPLRDYPTKECD